jgi:cell fate (sporulation/competence/biofilm development) regulator YlbF (YheA/YmcA/DUF963 family)
MNIISNPKIKIYLRWRVTIFMSFRWKAMGYDDDNNDDDVDIEIIGFSTDLNQTLQNVISQLEYVIELLQTIESANPESPEYQDAQQYLVPAWRGLSLTFQELVTAIDANESIIDDRQKKRLLSLIDEINEYINQVKSGNLSLHGFIGKLQEIKNTVENLIEPTETQIQLRTQLNEIISMLEKFKQVKNGDSLLLMMDNFERKWKPVTKLVSEEWSHLETFTELPTLQFLNPRNKARFEQLIDTIIAKIKTRV